MRNRGPRSPVPLIGIFMIGAGIVFTIQAAQESIFIALFGVFWTASVAVMVFRSFRASRSSSFRRWDPPEENTHTTRLPGEVLEEGDFCPYCGASGGSDFVYCNKCGNKLP